MGEFAHGVPHKKNTKKNRNGVIEHGKYEFGSIVGASFVMMPG